MSDKIIERIAKLLAHAEGTSNTDERAAFMAKADELMTAHRIEQWQLELKARERNGGPAPEPVKVYDARLIERASPIRVPLVDLTSRVARFCRVKIVWSGLHSTHMKTFGVNWIGYERDIEYARTLLASLRVQMVADLSPAADPALSLDDNIIRLKEAGLKWSEIHDELALADFEPYATEAHVYKHAVKLSKRYAKLCQDRGIPQLKTQPVTYKRSFAEGFVSEVSTRMREVEATRRRHEREAGGEAFAIEVRDRGKAVSDKMDELFPPKSLTRRGVRRSDNLSAAGWGAGREAGRRADIGLDRVGRGGGSRALGKGD